MTAVVRSDFSSLDTLGKFLGSLLSSSLLDIASFFIMPPSGGLVPISSWNILQNPRAADAAEQRRLRSTLALTGRVKSKETGDAHDTDEEEQVEEVRSGHRTCRYIFDAILKQR